MQIKQYPVNKNLIEIIEELGELEETYLEEVQEDFTFDLPDK